jgi:hypothetical protein
MAKTIIKLAATMALFYCLGMIIESLPATPDGDRLAFVFIGLTMGITFMVFGGNSARGGS